MPEFTIIIATCGRAKQLGRTLAAVAASVHRHQKADRIVVVDNDPAHAAESTVSECGQVSGAAVLYLQSRPRNKSAALNTGITQARTDWLAFTDDDVLPAEDWLVEADVCAATAKWRYFGGRIMADMAGARLPHWLSADRTGRKPATEGIFVQYAPLSATGTLGPAHPVPFGANAFARKDVFTAHGGYDELLWDICGKAALGVDDGEFGVRLKMRGEPLGYCHEARVTHPVHHDRCGLLQQVRANYRYGWRDPLVFFDPSRPLIEGYRLKLLAANCARIVLGILQARRGRSTEELLRGCRNAGALCARLSAGYRKQARRHSRAPGATGR